MPWTVPISTNLSDGLFQTRGPPGKKYLTKDVCVCDDFFTRVPTARVGRESLLVCCICPKHLVMFVPDASLSVVYKNINNIINNIIIDPKNLDELIENGLIDKEKNFHICMIPFLIFTNLVPFFGDVQFYVSQDQTLKLCLWVPLNPGLGPDHNVYEIHHPSLSKDILKTLSLRIFSDPSLQRYSKNPLSILRSLTLRIF